MNKKSIPISLGDRFFAYSFTASFSTATISASVERDITFSERASASVFVHLEITHLVAKTSAGFTLNSLSPKERRSGIKSGSEAASPHIPTGIPAAFPESIICFTERRGLPEFPELWLKLRSERFFLRPP